MNTIKKNGKIEFYRFIFCISILLFHLQKYFLGEAALDQGIHIALFPHGSVAVEFFFVLSGFLMAKSVYRERISQPEKANIFIAEDGISFLSKKYLSFFPHHLIAFIFAFITYTNFKNINGPKLLLTFVKSIPNLFLFEMSGISFTNPNHVEWYISSMLIVFALVYPLLKRHYDTFSLYYAPLAALFILGYMYHDSNCLTGVSTWMVLSYKGLFRALAEILLGIWCFRLSQYISQNKHSKRSRLFFTILECFSFFAYITYMVMTFKKDLEIFALFASMLLIIVAFSNISYTDKLFQNKICVFLGKFSFPIYLSQLSAVYFGQTYFTKYDAKTSILLCFILTLGLSVIVMLLGDLTAKKINFFLNKHNSKI